MANAHIYTTVTGADTNETIAAATVTFPYLKKSHLEIRASGAGDDLATFKTNLTAGITKLVYGTDYTVSDAGLITFIVSGTFANGSVYRVQVKRNSDISARYVDFADGSVVTEANLDDAQKQQIYLTQELADDKADLNEDGTIESNDVAFSGLTDTTIATPTAGQVPVYDGSDSWDNKTPSLTLTGDVTGTASMGSTGAVSLATTIADGSVQFDDLDGAAVVTESETIASNDNDTTLPTSAAVKDYVDTQLTTEDLDVTTDSGTIAIDLDSETMTVAGGTGIDTSATGNTVTAAIDSTVATLTGSQVLTNKTLTSPVLNTGVSGSAVLDSDTMSGVSATTLASSESIKAYVDSRITTEDQLSELNDTNIVSPTAGQVPVYDGSDSWDNKTPTVALTGDVSGSATMGATGEINISATVIQNASVQFDDLDGAAVVTESEGIASNDNETTLPTSAAVKDYADTKLGNVVEDTTPQLGGALDTAGNSITSTSNGNVTIAPDGTGQLALTSTEILVDEVSGPTTPAANKGALYAKDSGGVTKLYFKDSAGTESDLTAGSTSGELNQNAWSTITVPAGTTSQVADTSTDTIAFTAGGGMTITGGADDTIQFTSANDNTNQLTTFTVSATTDTTATTISQDDDLFFAAGTGITCETTADGTVTIANTVTNTDTKWDGGTTGLTASTGRTSLGLDIGSDVQAYDADTAKTDTAQAWTLPQRTGLLTDNDGSFDLSAKQNFFCTPGGAKALTFANPQDGQSGYVKLVNAGAYVHTADTNTKIHADDLTAIGAAGTFLLGYLSDGTDTWVTVSKALA